MSGQIYWAVVGLSSFGQNTGKQNNLALKIEMKKYRANVTIQSEKLRTERAREKRKGRNLRVDGRTRIK